MAEPPVENLNTLLHFISGFVAYAGRYLHEDSHPVHTHGFVEVAIVMGGRGTHYSLAGRQELAAGDVLLLRPGVWHGYESCRRLELFNLCFAGELLRNEMAWTREDPVLGHLLWTGPYLAKRRGMLTTALDPAALDECVPHLEALHALSSRTATGHRGDIIGWLTLILSCVARAAAQDEGLDDDGLGRTHQAVLEAIRMMEERPAHQWTLTELADASHLAPQYLVRIFRSATGLPPIAYLARYRLEAAAAQLLYTDEPIRRIAETVGWPDQNYFARRFKSHYGLTASTYRTKFKSLSARAPRHTSTSGLRCEDGRAGARGVVH